MFLKHWLGKFIAVSACVLVFLMTSQRLSEWSFRSSSLGTPSIRRPYSSAHANASDLASTSNSNDRIHPPVRPGDPSCASFPDTSNILLLVKTGATESYARIPTQLVTVLRCLPDFLIFSDLEQNIAGYHVYDSLDTVIHDAKDENPDFDLYRRQQACPVDQQSCNAGAAGSDQKREGWELDKYKNVHIAEKTYRLHPSYDWYLFIDADTYVLWRNLVQWLHKLNDPWNKKYYIGSLTLINDFPFAHGGSGYILSQATMWDLVGNHAGIANSYDMTAMNSCCGDYVLGLALNETINVGVNSAWPTINGEKPHSIPYGPREWCHPLEFEKRFYESPSLPDPTLRFKDIYHEFVEPKLSVRRDDWDNLSNDVVYLDRNAKHEQWQKNRAKKLDQQIRVSAVEMDAHKSFNHCRKLCDTVASCFQFSYHDGICAYSKSFMLGKPMEKTDEIEQRWVSGWNVNRIRTWVDRQGNCKEPVWPNV
ncbi:glycosyltransferase family 31 protein [Hypoxylon cercidicola]|nr:glycosyltransferase family 31 protein [Hypoxylon cercidicola]